VGPHTSTIRPLHRRLNGAHVSGLHAPDVQPVTQYWTKLHPDPSVAHASTAVPEHRSVPGVHVAQRPATHSRSHVSVVTQIPPELHTWAAPASHRTAPGAHSGEAHAPARHAVAQ
jgi:hypothetical protein